jgi:hypothetical protein
MQVKLIRSLIAALCLSLVTGPVLIARDAEDAEWPVAAPKMDGAIPPTSI